MLYQPRIRDPLIRKLYFLAKREGRPMTKVLHDIVATALVDEPEPPPYGEKGEADVWSATGPHRSHAGHTC